MLLKTKNTQCSYNCHYKIFCNNLLDRKAIYKLHNTTNIYILDNLLLIIFFNFFQLSHRYTNYQNILEIAKSF